MNKIQNKMKIWKIVIAIFCLSLLFLSGCVGNEIREAKYYDNNNIRAQLDENLEENDEIIITFFEKADYSLWISYSGGNRRAFIHSETLNFTICNIPYQYVFSKWDIDDFDIVILNKEI